MIHINAILLSASFLAGGMQEPELYKHNSNLQWRLVTDSLDRYCWRGDERVLDVGCGHGALTAYMAAKLNSGSILGVDVSEKMIQHAQASFQAPNLSFMRADARCLNFSNQFDVVFSSFTLHWVLQQQQAYKSLYNALAPGGTLLIVEAAKRDNYVGPLCQKLVASDKWALFFPDYKTERVYITQEEAHSLLVDAGFTPLSITVSTTETPFAGKSSLVGYLKPQLTFIAHLSDAQKEEFVSDLADAMIAIDPIDENGIIHYKLDKIEILATKKPEIGAG